MNWYYRFCGSNKKFLRIDEENQQEFGPSDIIVKPLVSGICGSDLSQIFHLKENFSLGHEWVGKIEKVGAKVSQYSIGDIVSSVANVRCGECSTCLEKNGKSCKRKALLGKGQKSILSNQITLDFNDLIPVPKGLTLEDAVMLEVAYIGDCSYYAAKRLGISDKPKVLIFGAGPIGIYTALSFKLRGVEDLTLVETVPFRIKKAHELGFAAKPFAQIILDETELSSYDVVMDCTGDHNGPGALKVLPLFAKEYGAVVVVGKYYQSRIDEKIFIGKTLKVTWVANHKHKDFVRSIEFWKDKIAAYTGLLTTSFRIEKINEAYEQAKKRGTIKCLLKY